MKPIRVFVDTGAWYALQVVDDHHHADAVQAMRALLERPAALVTTNHVIGETYTLLRVTRGYRAAAKFLDSLARTTRLERIFVSEQMEQRAYQCLIKFSEHDFSFVDATSFAVMRNLGLCHACAFDSHFATAGFIRVPMDMPAQELMS